MEIKIKLGTKEVDEVIKAYIIKTLPIENIENKEIFVSNSYGTFYVEIDEKKLNESADNIETEAP